MSEKFKSHVLQFVYESARALRDVGAIDDATLREFEEACIARTPDDSAAQPEESLGADDLHSAISL
jgi:putative transcriptional regulator